MRLLQNYNLPNYEFKNQGTGSHGIPDRKTKVINFDNYVITVELSEDDKFIGIIEVKVKKEFLNFQQKIIPKSFHDVDALYKE